jgi:hypothetical protein
MRRVLVSPLGRIRRWLLGVLVFELIGTFVELLLLQHFEDTLQWVPLVLIMLTLFLIAWHVARPQAANVRALQVAMGALALAGVVGVGAHLQGAAEFQMEMDPSQPRWNIFKKALQAQAPPALAPGVMLQMGLLGLVYAYRHPGAAADDAAPHTEEIK